MSEARELIERIATELRTRGQTLSFAESCTGGLLSSLVTELAGVSDIFMGSIVSYSNQIKIDLLDVPPTLLKSVGAVSLPVARAMALGARETLVSDWAVSVTGIAGPGGGSPEKPVGTVCFAVCGPGIDEGKREQFSGGRRDIQMKSATYALQLLAGYLGLSAN